MQGRLNWHVHDNVIWCVQECVAIQLEHLYFHPTLFRLPDPKIALRNHPLFIHLSDATFNRVVHESKMMHVSNGRTLGFAGDAGSDIFLVISGSMSRKVCLLHFYTQLCFCLMPPSVNMFLCTSKADVSVRSPRENSFVSCKCLHCEEEINEQCGIL